jgi:hypothetical protein
MITVDPQACLNEMLEAIIGGELDVAQERLNDLVEWTRKGGFTPNLRTALENHLSDLGRR